MTRNIRPRMNKREYDAYLEWKEKRSNVLVVGDLHLPFVLDGYLEHCQAVYEKYKCDEVVFIGDIIDNHFASYHEVDPDGFGGGEELKRARKELAKWYKAFPYAKVCLGNHDILPNRKAFSSGLSKAWIKPISEVLETPNWEYADSFLINKVYYNHGTGRKAYPRMLDENTSVVQGHYHSDSYVRVHVTHEKTIFAVQVGCGVDRECYAMAYGRNMKKPFINCAAILNGGRNAVIEPMILK